MGPAGQWRVAAAGCGGIRWLGGSGGHAAQDSRVHARVRRECGRAGGREGHSRRAEGLRGGAVLIEQVDEHLLENSAKYTPPGTPVRIGAVAYGGELIVSV